VLLCFFTWLLAFGANQSICTHPVRVHTEGVSSHAPQGRLLPLIVPRPPSLSPFLPVYAQMRENDQKSKRAFSSIFEVDQEKIEFARQRQAWEQEKSDWEDRKAQWIQMAVVEEEKRQEEEKRREKEMVEWRIAAEREVERRVLEQTMAIEEASRIATVKVIDEYEERSRLLEAAMQEKIRLVEEQNNIARAKMEEEIYDLHDMAGSLPFIYLPLSIFPLRTTSCSEPA